MSRYVPLYHCEIFKSTVSCSEHWEMRNIAVMVRRDLCLLIIIVVFASGIHAMSRPQLKNAGKALKKNCMAKNNVTEDLVGNIEKGKFIEERNVMCYIACIYQLIQVLKNNKINYEASIQYVERMYPPEIRQTVKSSIDSCRHLSKIKDPCESSYFSAKCMYEFSPKDFVFP